MLGTVQIGRIMRRGGARLAPLWAYSICERSELLKGVLLTLWLGSDTTAGCVWHMQALCNSRAGQEKCLVVVAAQILANGAYDKKPVIGNMGKIESQRPSWKEDADPGQVPFRHASPPTSAMIRPCGRQRS